MVLHRGPASGRRRGYSNAQFAVSRPHEDLAVVVNSHAEMKVNGDRVTGTLSDLGARLLLVHDGENDVELVAAAGTLELIIRAGWSRNIG